jgi:hypothetical protein
MQRAIVFAVKPERIKMLAIPTHRELDHFM